MIKYCMMHTLHLGLCHWVNAGALLTLIQHNFFGSSTARKKTNINIYLTLSYPHHDIYIICFVTSKSSGILSGISPGISPGTLSGISSDILSSKSSGILSGKHYGTLSGIPSGTLSGIPTGILSGILSIFWHSSWHIFWHSI